MLGLSASALLKDVDDDELICPVEIETVVLGDDLLSIVLRDDLEPAGVSAAMTCGLWRLSYLSRGGALNLESITFWMVSASRRSC